MKIKQLKPRSKFWLSTLLISLSTGSLLAGCAARPPEAGQLLRLEFYQRWTHSDFSAAWLPEAWAWLDPAARAELPPQYQSAFSLVLEPVAGVQALDARYHYRMVTDASTQRRALRRYGSEVYQRLQTETSGKVACESKVSPGWAGPAPKLLRLDYSDRSELLYVGGPQGPDGPGRTEQGLRRYLCREGLQALLGEILAELDS